jgi:hypothetical protein
MASVGPRNDPDDTTSMSSCISEPAVGRPFRKAGCHGTMADGGVGQRIFVHVSEQLPTSPLAAANYF